jgi:hypothetical protein
MWRAYLILFSSRLWQDSLFLLFTCNAGYPVNSYMLATYTLQIIVASRSKA